MKLSNTAKKFLVISIILLLVLSFNFTISVSAKDPPYYDDGVYFDNFENKDHIDLVDCNHSNGIITLKEGDPTITYDQKETPGKIEAWEIEEWDAEFNGGGLLDFIITFVSPDSPLMPKIDFEEEDYTAIEAEDDNTVVTTTQVKKKEDYSFYPMHQFKFKTDYNSDIAYEIDIEWQFGPYKNYNLEKITMFAWNYNNFLPRWDQIDSILYTESSDIHLQSAESPNYISDDGYVDILVVGTPLKIENRTRLATDYVKLTVTLVEGFFPKGSVTSEIIEPNSLYGWESLIWTGSRPSTYTNIKIQVLDEVGNVITSLDGNKEGFTTSPIDLSSLDSEQYKKIRLRANFTSKSIRFTPRLYDWGVMWQTVNNKFKDSFGTTYRIDESYGVKIENGDVKISEFYSDWEIFGKNPANTRSYIGPEDVDDTGKIYWISDPESDLGGGLRSPVVYDGFVYVASKDNKIYAFNLTANTIWDEEEDKFQIPIDSSQNIYPVESSLAVGGGLVVFGESTLNSTSNKIRALNASKLSEEKWSYSLGDDNTEFVCFSASPTIANGRVFITSCHGLFADPITLGLANKINTMLKSIPLIGSYLELFKTNKLYALDLNSGTEIWPPVRLPACSYSTPAVDNGCVFVGCENLEGTSLICFDENSGEQIWNASVGLVGRSSPVVGDVNNKKAVFVIGREKEFISPGGTDTIYAFDAETGEILWNVTFEDNSSSLWFLLKRYGINNLAPMASPISTPAYHEGILYMLSQSGILYALDVNNNGELKWFFDVGDGGSLIGTILPSYNFASPIVVDDTVYVVNENSNIYALESTNQGSVKWEYQIEDPRYADPSKNLIFSSPVMVDGLLVASTIEDNDGRMYVIGDYTENTEGKIVSIPIHVQRGKWWKDFDANFQSTANNTITFAILDENGNPLSGMSNLNGSNNDISSIKENVVRLSATLKIGNSEEITEPILRSWEIEWETENKKPEFIKNSFRAGEGQQGWINLVDLPECSIEVRDVGVGDVTSGLDVDSAKFTLEYLTEESDDPVTGVFDAECEGEPGVEQATIVAKISELPIDFTYLGNISFSIKDLAGNENTSETIKFQIDTGIPGSNIQNISDFEDTYNTPVRIIATGTEDESGIASITLYYKGLNDTDWKQYGSTESPFEWEFSMENSSYYEFCTIATDLAGNKEAFPDEGDVLFHYDQNEPYEPEFEEEYSFNKLPTFNDVTFADDYELSSVEYRIFDDYILIANDTYTDEWEISQSDWNTMIEDVTYHMYFRVTDLCGNQYETPSEYEALILTKDLTPPAADITIDVSDFAGGGWKETYTIKADIAPDEIDDFESASLEYSYSADNEKWSDWKQYGDDLTDDPFEWEFKAKKGSGYYKFKITIWDDASGFAETPVEKVSITMFPTVPLLLMIVLIVVLIAATIIIIKKFRKKKE